MGKDPTKPRGKMSSYAYFVQTCREEHKKKHPEATVNFSEFSKKCSERWKVSHTFHLHRVNAISLSSQQWFFFLLFLRLCQPRKKGSLKIWPNLTRHVTRGRWRTTFHPKARRKRGLKTPTLPRDPRKHLAWSWRCIDICEAFKVNNFF